MLPADTLVRVRRDGDGLVAGSGPGRGAWVGPAVQCVEAAAQRRGFARGLRAEVNAAAIARLQTSWPPEPIACPHASD